jgi:hypothetical protein
LPTLTTLALVVLLGLSACGGNASPPTAVPTSRSTPTSGAVANSTPTVGAPPTFGGSPSAQPPSNEAAIANDATRAAALPACNETLNNHGFMSYESFEANMICIIPYFSWPPGRFPNMDWINTQVPQDKDPSHYPYQTGLEYTVIGGNNICAWQLTWLDARKSGDTVLEKEALRVMTDVIPNFRTLIRGFPPNVFDAGTVSYQKQISLKAALGDPSDIEASSQGCLAIQWASGS